ncbi:MAG: M56 family metallopeptidase [Acidobacteriota bacterium]|nr:M56 family metallopeptidase [Acidobacteriota bacterium]
MTTALKIGFAWLAEASLWFWPRLTDHLWQTTLFAIFVLAATLSLRRGPARMRHTLWLLAAAKFIVPAALVVFLAQQAGVDSLPFFIPVPGTQQNAQLVRGLTEPASNLAFNYEMDVVASAASNHSEVYSALTGLWLSGGGALLVIWGIRRRRFLRSLSLGQAVRSGREWELLKRAQTSLGLKDDVALVISPLKIEPAVFRVWRPVVVLPESIAHELDDDELQAIMLHEWIHIQRHDNLTANLQLALCALMWFHPLVWFIGRKLFDERELACDERVMEICGAPETYASSILKVVRFCFGWKVAGVSGAASGTNLRRRIENIMSTGKTKRRAGPVSRLLAGGLVGIALLILVGAGVYSRPRSASAAASETGTEPFAITLNDGVVSSSDPAAASNSRGKKSKRSKPAQPAIPPSPAVPASPEIDAPAAPPAPASPATPMVHPARSAPPAPAAPAAPAVPAKPSDQQKVKGKLEKGGLIEAPSPVYPEEAKKDKVEGLVTVAIVIGDDGNVISAKAKSGPDALHAAAETAASKARFRPSTLNGKPVKVSGAMSYNFVLDKK